MAVEPVLHLIDNIVCGLLQDNALVLQVVVLVPSCGIERDLCQAQRACLCRVVAFGAWEGWQHATAQFDFSDVM